MTRSCEAADAPAARSARLKVGGRRDAADASRGRRNTGIIWLNIAMCFRAFEGCLCAVLLRTVYKKVDVFEVVEFEFESEFKSSNNSIAPTMSLLVLLFSRAVLSCSS